MTTTTTTISITTTNTSSTMNKLCVERIFHVRLLNNQI